jgi:hypothetical protein
MAPDDEESEDLYDDEFDFVDDDEEDADEDEDDESDLDADDADADDDKGGAGDDSDLEEKPAPIAAGASRDAYDEGADDAEPIGDDEDVDEYGRPEPAANFRVHIYEYQQFKRTIDRPFTPEDAEAFASEYNRTSKSYGRFAVAGKEDAKPRKTLD